MAGRRGAPRRPALETAFLTRGLQAGRSFGSTMRRPRLTGGGSRPITPAGRYRNAGQCSGLQAGGEGPRWEGRQGPSSAVDLAVTGPDTVTGVRGEGPGYRCSPEAPKRQDGHSLVVAAGLAETLNARGVDVRPGLALADCGEARTHLDVAHVFHAQRGGNLRPLGAGRMSMHRVNPHVGLTEMDFSTIRQWLEAGRGAG
jgi:hypothetical protein